MGQERSRTLVGFDLMSAISPEGSPFHGWPDQHEAGDDQHLQHSHPEPRHDQAGNQQQSSQMHQDFQPYSQQMSGATQSSNRTPAMVKQWQNSLQQNSLQRLASRFGANPAQPVYQPTPLWQPHPLAAAANNYGQNFGPPNPDPGNGVQPQAGQATASVAALRSWFPLLHSMPDEMLIATDLNTLMALNKSLQPTQGAMDPMAQAAEMWAAAAARMSAPVTRPEDEPAIMMAKTLETLQGNPTAVPAGFDYRCKILHPARFLGGAVCPKTLWREARIAIGLDGVPPLSNYNLTCMGLGGCVTMRGFKEMANPASPHNTLKLYSSSNMSSSTGATRRLTLADGNSSVNIGENLKEISDLNELKLAVRAMCRAAQLILPWNASYNAIDGFLHTTNYGYADLNGRSNRAQILTEFINYILGLNAAAWVQKEDFHTSGEIKTLWTEWFGSRPASLLSVAKQEETAATTGGQGVAGSSNGGANRGRGRGRGGGRQNHSGGGQQQQTFTTPPPTINNSQGGGGGGGGRQMLCRRFNYGNCPNTAATCALPSGTKLHHRCDQETSPGVICNGGHPRIQHR
jgi:hypothetical protein